MGGAPPAVRLAKRAAPGDPAPCWIPPCERWRSSRSARANVASRLLSSSSTVLSRVRCRSLASAATRSAALWRPAIRRVRSDCTADMPCRALALVRALQLLVCACSAARRALVAPWRPPTGFGPSGKSSARAACQRSCACVHEMCARCVWHSRARVSFVSVWAHKA